MVQSKPLGRTGQQKRLSSFLPFSRFTKVSSMPQCTLIVCRLIVVKLRMMPWCQFRIHGYCLEDA